MEPDIYRQWYEFEKDHWWTKGMRYLCESVISKYCGSGKKNEILDIGCGTGELTKTLGAFGRVTGADLSSEALGFCRK